MTRRFTEEEKEVIDRIHAVRVQIQHEMKGMTKSQRLAYMNQLGRDAIVKNGLQKKHSEGVSVTG
jgi:hypothetical protein